MSLSRVQNKSCGELFAIRGDNEKRSSRARDVGCDGWTDSSTEKSYRTKGVCTSSGHGSRHPIIPVDMIEGRSGEQLVLLVPEFWACNHRARATRGVRLFATFPSCPLFSTLLTASTTTVVKAPQHHHHPNPSYDDHRKHHWQSYSVSASSNTTTLRKSSSIVFF